MMRMLIILQRKNESNKIHGRKETKCTIKKMKYQKNDTKFRITKERSENYMENCTKKTYNISIGTDKIPSS